MLGTAFSSLLALLLQSTNVDSFLPEEAFFYCSYLYNYTNYMV